MLQTLRSLACEELAYTFRARLRRWELRTLAVDRGVGPTLSGQLGSRLQVRQIEFFSGSRTGSRLVGL